MVSLNYVLPTVATLVFVIVTSPVFSQDVPPDVLVKTISRNVIAAIKADKDMRADHPKKLADLAEAEINPYLDFQRMTQSALAKNWRVATAEQQERLTGSFKTLLVSTYSKALVAFRNRDIEYRPTRGDPASGVVTVRSELLQAGQQPTVIDYDLGKTPLGWRIFDIKVDGASLAVTYRDNFAAIVRNHGIDGLIVSLNDKNRQNSGGARVQPTDAGRTHFESR